MPTERPTPHRFALIELLLEAISECRPLVEKIRRHDRHAADQLKRAATRAPLLVAEGNKHDDGNRHAKLKLAAGEVDEARVALTVAVRWGYVTCGEIARAEERLERAQKILYRITH
jgi:four helix bundle protein